MPSCSRPAYCAVLDNHPVGILWLKGELQALANGRIQELTELLHPPLFVPETTKISAVLRQFQRQHEHLGLVVDEYGGVVGLITIEDILEEIVGDIGEKGRPDDARSVTRLPDGALIVDGLAPIDEIRAAGVPIDDSPDAELRYRGTHSATSPCPAR